MEQRILLIASIFLVVVAVVISDNENIDAANTSYLTSNDKDNTDTSPPVEITYKPATPSPTTPSPTTPSPSSQPSSSPVIKPSPSPKTNHDDVDLTSTTFYVTGGDIYNTNADADNKSIDFNTVLTNLPNTDGEWLVHLGDFNDPTKSQCNVQSYQDFSSAFTSSSIPVLFVPGENDWNECPVPQTAWQNWITYLSSYNANGIVKPGVQTQNGRPENFVLKQGKVMFIGLNMVGGGGTKAKTATTTIDNNGVDDPTSSAWSERLVQNYEWVNTNVEMYRTSIEVVVLFGNSADEDGINAAFFDPLVDAITNWNKLQPLVFLYITKSDEQWSIKQQYLGNKKLMRINIEESLLPPMQIVIDTKQDKLRFDQENWYKA